MWTRKIKDQTARSVQSYLDLHCPQKLFVSLSVWKELKHFCTTYVFLHCLMLYEPQIFSSLRFLYASQWPFGGQCESGSDCRVSGFWINLNSFTPIHRYSLHPISYQKRYLWIRNTWVDTIILKVLSHLFSRVRVNNGLLSKFFGVKPLLSNRLRKINPLTMTLSISLAGL